MSSHSHLLNSSAALWAGAPGAPGTSAGLPLTLVVRTDEEKAQSKAFHFLAQRARLRRLERREECHQARGHVGCPAAVNTFGGGRAPGIIGKGRLPGLQRLGSQNLPQICRLWVMGLIGQPGLSPLRAGGGIGSGSHSGGKQISVSCYRVWDATGLTVQPF